MATITRTEFSVKDAYDSVVQDAKYINACWVAPEADEIAKESDVRGVFQKLSSSTLTIKNVTTGTITLYHNAPKTKSGQQTRVLRRDVNCKIDIKAGKTYSVTVGYTDKKAVNYPVRMEGVFDRMMFHYFIVRDDINHTSGLVYNDDEIIADIKLTAVYQVNMAQPIGYKIKNSSEFNLRDLSSVSNFGAIQKDLEAAGSGTQVGIKWNTDDGYGTAMSCVQITTPDGNTIDPGTAKFFRILVNKQDTTSYANVYGTTGKKANLTQQLFIPGADPLGPSIWRFIDCSTYRIAGQDEEGAQDIPCDHQILVEMASNGSPEIVLSASALFQTDDKTDGSFAMTGAIGLMFPVESLSINWGNIIAYLEAAVEVIGVAIKVAGAVAAVLG